MKKSIFLLVVLCLLSTVSYCQIQHAKGVRTIGASYLLTKDGSGILFEFAPYLSNKVYLKGGLGLESGEKNQLEYKGYIFDASALYTFFDLNERIFFNAQGGLNGSFYKINNEGYDEKEFKYGPFLGLEIESYVTQDLILVLNTNQRFFFSDAFGKNRYFIAIGLKYQL